MKFCDSCLMKLEILLILILFLYYINAEEDEVEDNFSNTLLDDLLRSVSQQNKNQKPGGHSTNDLEGCRKFHTFVWSHCLTFSFSFSMQQIWLKKKKKKPEYISISFVFGI